MGGGAAVVGGEVGGGVAVVGGEVGGGAVGVLTGAGAAWDPAPVPAAAVVGGTVLDDAGGAVVELVVEEAGAVEGLTTNHVPSTPCPDVCPPFVSPL